MNADVAIGIGALVLVVVSWAAAVRTHRRWLRIAAGITTMAAWATVAQLLLPALVPPMVTAMIMLGGIVVAILATAVVGTIRSRRK